MNVAQRNEPFGRLSVRALDATATLAQSIYSIHSYRREYRQLSPRPPIVPMAVDAVDTFTGSYRYPERVLDTFAKSYRYCRGHHPERVSGALRDIHKSFECTQNSRYYQQEFSARFKRAIDGLLASSRPELPPRHAIIALDILDSLSRRQCLQLQSPGRRTESTTNCHRIENSVIHVSPLTSYQHPEG